jgi:hypothetical protein
MDKDIDRLFDEMAELKKGFNSDNIMVLVRQCVHECMHEFTADMVNKQIERENGIKTQITSVQNQIDQVLSRL